jgi:hypothetical protein
MSKRQIVEAALSKAYSQLIVPTAGTEKPSHEEIAKVVQNDPTEYARKTEAYIWWEMVFFRSVLVVLGVLVLIGVGCLIFVVAFGESDAIKFGGLGAGLVSLVGIIYGNPWKSAQERRAALIDVRGYNIQFLTAVSKCSGEIGCIAQCVKDYQAWVRSL